MGLSDREQFAFLEVVYRVVILARFRSSGPDRLPDDQLYDLMDSIHNIPAMLAGTDKYFTPQMMRDVYLAAYDAKWAGKGQGLVALLDDAYARFDAG